MVNKVIGKEKESKEIMKDNEKIGKSTDEMTIQTTIGGEKWSNGNANRISGEDGGETVQRRRWSNIEWDGEEIVELRDWSEIGWDGGETVERRR